MPTSTLQSDPAFRVRVGSDLVPVQRIESLLRDHGRIDDIFTTAELAYCSGRRRRSEHLAARFAAKEAMLKALGTGLARGMKWTDVEIINNYRGKPQVQLRGAVADRAEHVGVCDIDVSLTHVPDYALAHVVTLERIDQDSKGKRDAISSD